MSSPFFSKVRFMEMVTASAVVPEQLPVYVRAVGDCEALPCPGEDSFVWYLSGSCAVLAAYPPYAPGVFDVGQADAQKQAAFRDNLGRALGSLPPGAKELILLSPVAAPLELPLPAGLRAEVVKPGTHAQDWFWTVPLPCCPPTDKIRNLLRRADQEVIVTTEDWGPETASLAALYCRTRDLEEGTRHIYSRIGSWLKVSPDARLFVARRRTDGRLAACAVGDFSALGTAFYMFAFRQPDAPPGCADVLLYALMEEGNRRGHAVLNLGLGIGKGIEFFKKKWGATRGLPYYEAHWNLKHAARCAVRFADRAEPVESTAADPLRSPAFRMGFWQEVKESLLGSRKILDCVQIEVSSFCGGRCTYCPHTTDRNSWISRHMDAETFARLWPLLRQSHRAHLQGWGEPLLHPRFFDFVAFARRAGCAVSTTTCGLRMDENIARTLVASGMDVVAFSLTGTDAVSNAVREGVDFDRVLESIRLLQKVRRRENGVHLEIHLAYLMLADRVESVRALPDLMDALDIHAAVVSTLDYLPSPDMADLAFSPPVTPYAAAKVEAARAVLEEARHKAQQRGRELYFALPAAVPAPQCRENTRHTVAIDTQGNMSPCVYLNVPSEARRAKNLGFGNVRERDPLEIWHDPTFVDCRDRILTEHPPAGCVGCPKRFEQAG